MADAAIIGSRVPARSLLLASTDPRSHPGDGRPFFGPNVTTLVVQHQWDGVLWPRPARRSAKGCAQSRSAALADMDRASAATVDHTAPRRGKKPSIAENTCCSERDPAATG